jgi:hypothetical protein
LAWCIQPSWHCANHAPNQRSKSKQNGAATNLDASVRGRLCDRNASKVDQTGQLPHAVGPLVHDKRSSTTAAQQQQKQKQNQQQMQQQQQHMQLQQQ